MSWAVRASRDANGTMHVNLGLLWPEGWNNVVAEEWFCVNDGELDVFLAEIAAARKRAAEATGRLDEHMPGPYDGWPQWAEIAERQRADG